MQTSHNDAPVPITNYNGHACSINSLTQCLHSLKLFRDKILEFKIDENSFIYQKDYMDIDKMKESRRYYCEGKKFIEEYQKVFAKWETFNYSIDQYISLEQCGNHFYTTKLNKILREPNDPHTEYIAILNIFSIQSMFPYSFNLTNDFSKDSIKSLFELSYFHTAYQTVKTEITLDVDCSSIFNINLEKNFFNFKKNQKSKSDDKNLNEIIKLPPIIAAYFNTGYKDPNLKMRKLQMELDFSDYCLNQKPAKYELQSFIVLTAFDIHAFAFVRKGDISNPSWYYCSDHIVEEISNRKFYDKYISRFGNEYKVEMAFYTRSNSN